MDHEKRKKTEPKQVIVARKDLQMPPGKLSAQVAHASMAAVFEMSRRTENSIILDWQQQGALEKWLKERFTKVVLQVKSEDKLISIYEKAKEAGLPVSLITDAGFTVFNGEPTKTCLAIGPVYPDQLIGITDKLQMYK